MNKNLKTALIIGGIVLVALPLIFSLVSGSQFGGGGMMGSGMMGGMMGGFGGMGLMSIVWIVVLGLIIWAVVAAVKKPGNNSMFGSADSALEILKRSYARGEINKDEFEAKKKDLA